MILRLLLLCSALLFATSSWAQGVNVRILDVHDGDTLSAIGIADPIKYKIRLLGVDTPEVDFFKHHQGEAAVQAREALRQLIPKNSLVVISSDSQIDKHGRVLGRILKDGLDINKEMLRRGWGFLYFISPFEKRILTDYSEAAREGFENQQGLFAGVPPEEPYLFRLHVRKQEGRNPVGDLKTKRIYAPEEIAQIPVWRRVFFPDLNFARQLGYH